MDREAIIVLLEKRLEGWNSRIGSKGLMGCNYDQVIGKITELGYLVAVIEAGGEDELHRSLLKKIGGES